MEKGNMDTDSVRLPKQLAESIKSIIANVGYKTYEIKCKNISLDGGSYIGVLYEIDITGLTLDGIKETNICIKQKVENDQLRIYSIADCFIRESYVYKELAGIFNELQNEARVPDNEQFAMAKSYYECNEESIILENLTKRGFKIYNRMDVVTLEYAEMSIEHLAKFHGLSFVIQEKMPNYFKDNIKPMHQPFVFGDDWQALVKNLFKFSMDFLEPDMKLKLEDLIWKKVANYGNYMNDTNAIYTLCHGDYKHNNIMAKEVNGTLTEVLAIDYQLLHYGNPVLDLIYFIFNGTDQTFRQNHLSNIKKLYFDTLKKFLKYFNIDIESVFPVKKFEREFKEKLDFGLMINVFYVPFLFVCKEDAPDVVNQSLDKIDLTLDTKFGERFRGVVDDFIHWGYL